MNDRPLAPCPACRRHVADELTCPFCATPLAIKPTVRPTLPGRFSRAAVFAGATLVGCSSGSSSNEPAPPPARPVVRADAPPAPPPLPDAPTRARVVGRKLTFSGHPLKDSEVALVDPNAPTGAGKGSAGSGGSASTPGRWVVRTDHDGNFAFEDIEPGDYLLESPGAQHAIHLETGTNHVDFVMPKPPEVHRAVNMPYGAPPARYRIV